MRTAELPAAGWAAFASLTDNISNPIPDSRSEDLRDFSVKRVEDFMKGIRRENAGISECLHVIAVCIFIRPFGKIDGLMLTRQAVLVEGGIYLGIN